MATQLSGEEFEAARNNFKEIDKDADGKITREELKLYCVTQNEIRTDVQIDYMMKIMDLDGNGTIEFSEFLEMVSFFEYKKQPYSTQIKHMFNALDKNQDGFLSTEEIRHLWNIFTNDNFDMPSEEEIEDIIKNLDTNGDGRIDYNEFLSHFDFDLINAMWFAFLFIIPWTSAYVWANYD